MAASHLDVAIVGAGPAGSWAAYRLVRGGARVAIVDGSHPREKPCGGGVTGRALAVIGDAVNSPRLRAAEIDGVTFGSRGRTARCALAAGDAHRSVVVASRREFDAALLHAAIVSGAHLIAERAVDVAPGCVKTRKGELRADWVLGADGANSLVRRRVAAAFARADLSIATGYFVRGATSREIDVEFTDHPQGYLWSFPRPDHLAIGICAQADTTTVAALRARSLAWIQEHVPGPHRLEPYSWPIPSLQRGALRRERPAGRQWLLLGDAAGLVDPITREGIYFALRSADLAAESLLTGRDPASTYADRLRREIYPELERAASLKARFYQPRFIDLLIRALQRSAAVRAVMVDLIAGEQSYAGLRRRLISTFEWRLMLELFGIA